MESAQSTDSRSEASPGPEGELTSSPQGQPEAPRPFNFGLIVLLFLASGFSSLIYQVVWTRHLVLIFGSTTFATATVLAVFMGGLALGSYVAGRLSSAIKRPFLWYGILEGVIGLWAFLVPLLFAAAVPLYQAVWQQLHLSVLPFSLLRFLMAALVLLLPTACMGATLPLLARFVTTRLDIVGRRVGTLYAVNTLGAVAGAALAGFVLLPACGLQSTTTIAALINFLLCGAVLWIAPWMERQREPVVTEVFAAPEDEVLLTSRTRLVMLAFAMSGAIAMIYEVGWTRTLLMVIGSSTYAFTVMLTTFLVGIFLGSLICARFADRMKDPVAWFAIFQFFVCLAGFVGMMKFNLLPFYNLVINSAYPQDPSTGLLIRFLLSSTVMLPLTLGLGAIFPVVVKACTKDLEAVGKSVGTLYSCNTLGAIIGAFLAGFVLVPWLGVEKTLLFCSAANFLLGVGLMLLIRPMGVVVRAAAVVAGAVVAGWCLSQSSIWDRTIILSAQAERRQLLMVPFAYTSFSDWQKALHQQVDVLFWKDGASSTVGLLQYKNSRQRSLVTNGHVDASDGADMQTQIGLAAYPLLWKPEAKEVAVIGWGSGVSIGTATRFPVRSITAIELEPAVLEAAKYFHHVNHVPEKDPRVHLEINDGRNYLLATDKRFDVIISEPSNPWQAGVCNLFTREYFEICRSRLNPGGVLSFWLQTVEIPPENMAGILASLHEVFPHTVALMADYGNLVVLASDKPLELDMNAVKQALADKAVASDLSRMGVRSAEGLVARIESAADGMETLVAGARPNIDDTNHLEYAVGKTYETTYFSEKNHQLLERNLGRPWKHVAFGELSGKEKALSMAAVARNAVMLNRLERTNSWSKASQEVAPNSEALRIAGISRREQGSIGDSERLWKEALALNPAHIETLQTRGMARLQAGDRENARADFLEVLRLEPKNKAAAYHVAGTYAPLGMVAQPPRLTLAFDTPQQSPNMVLRYLQGPLEDPAFIRRHHDVLYLASLAHYSLGDKKESESLVRRYLTLEPKSVGATRLLGGLLFDRGATGEASYWWFASFTLGRGHADAQVRKAGELLKENKQGKAVALLSYAMELFPGQEEAFSLLCSLAPSNKEAARIVNVIREPFTPAPGTRKRRLLPPVEKSVP